MSRKLPPPKGFVDEAINKAKPEEMGFKELVRLTLEAIEQGDEDLEMELRAVLMSQFRLTEQRINTALIKRLTAQEAGTDKASYGPANMESCEGLDWLVDGFILDKDQTLLYGEAGTGKTSAAIEIAFCMIDGKQFLNHGVKPKPGQVLFISSDSGRAPLKELLKRMRYGNHSALSDGRFTVWAHSREDQRIAWDSSIAGCIALLNAVKKHRYVLVIIDSCKAVTTKADQEYTNNKEITALLTFFQEVICQYCAVLWLNHDGKEHGAHAGAKIWREIPSCVHAIEMVYPKDMKGRKLDQPSSDIRKWTVRKCRKATDNSFTYKFNPEIGRLQLTEDSALLVSGNCTEAVLQTLSQAQQASLSRKDVIERCNEKGYSTKTVDNTLSDLVRRRLVVRQRRGYFALAPSQQLATRRMRSEREEIEADLSDSNESANLPESSQACHSGKTPPPPTSFQEVAGKSQETSQEDGSRHSSSRSPHCDASQLQTSTLK